MAVEKFQLLRNVGQFDSFNAGANTSLAQLTLVYAENGRGKTTLATVLRSLSKGDSAMIENRRRLGSTHRPHVVLTISGSQIVYQNGAWSQPLPRVAVFDDAFVAANVCSGIEIETTHRQNLHELILGAQGVALNNDLQRHVTAIEQHNKQLREKEAAIPEGQRGGLTVDAFCSLPADPAIDTKIQDAERKLAAARDSASVREREAFTPVTLPVFDLTAVQTLLGRTLVDLQATATTQVRQHMRCLGRGGEGWVEEGMTRRENLNRDHDEDLCPFCAQDLNSSPLISHYETYFSDAYSNLKTSINEIGKGVKAAHDGDVQASFERAIRIAVQNREFWNKFIEISEINIDTASIIRNWSAARDAVLSILRVKAAAPLESVVLPADAAAAIEAYERHVETVSALSTDLIAYNGRIAIVKTQAAAANVAALTGELARLRAVKARHTTPLNTACDTFVAEKAAKSATEQARNAARTALENYRTAVFPVYERAINEYLTRFNAGFRLGAVGSVNTRAGSSATYNVVINNFPVELTASGGPSFRTTLSAGDRNTLALAFFFASLEQDPNRADTIVVIDDPMTSLDEHRTITTVEEIRQLARRVRQVIVFSHSKQFLCQMWEGSDTQTRAALRIIRDGAGSTITTWDVHQDCITEHDRRHDLVRAYLRTANPATERVVAQALRPILEAYLRVAYPAEFPPGTLIGPFIGVCCQRVGQVNQVLSQGDIDELERLKNYANRFHHDSNPAWQTAAINDLELTDFIGRTIKFTRR